MPARWLVALIGLTLLASGFAPSRALAQPNQTLLVTTRPPVVEQAAPEPPPAPAPPPEPSRSRSVGRPNVGRLRDGVRLRTGEHVRARGSHPYGTAELVALLERVAARVRAEHPGGVRLSVADLSGPRGGRIRPHRSHRSGRDADVGFYLVTEAGEPTEAPGFVNLDSDGCGPHDGARYCWDGRRNWALIAALAEDSTMYVQYVFVANDLRERLLNEGLRQGASPELIARVETLTQLRRGSEAHRNHFHVRIYCPDDDRPLCSDDGPIHPWVVRRPPPRPERARPRRRARRVSR